MSEPEDRIHDYAQELLSYMMDDDGYQEMVDSIIQAELGIDAHDLGDGGIMEDSDAYRLWYETAATIATKVLAQAITQVRHFPDPR